MAPGIKHLGAGESRLNGSATELHNSEKIVYRALFDLGRMWLFSKFSTARTFAQACKESARGGEYNDCPLETQNNTFQSMIHALPRSGNKASDASSCGLETSSSFKWASNYRCFNRDSLPYHPPNPPSSVERRSFFEVPGRKHT
jgi:hypothetical protein